MFISISTHTCLSDCPGAISHCLGPVLATPLEGGIVLQGWFLRENSAFLTDQLKKALFPL